MNRWYRRMAVTLLTVMGAGAMGAEFYSLNLAEPEGSVLVATDGAGKQKSARSTWGMWPRTPDSVGAKFVSRDGIPALEIEPGFQINSSEWSTAENDAQQSVVYVRAKFLVPLSASKGLLGTFRLQQVNNRTAAFVAFEPRNGRIAVLISNGDGKGTVNWEQVGSVEPGAWFTLDLTLDFNSRTSAIAVAGGDAATGKKFRHAEAWVGSMWAQDLNRRDYRYDIEAAPAGPIYLGGLVFSADPIQE